MTRSTTRPTALPTPVTREEWLAARRELLRAEEEATRARDALVAKRRALPMVRIDKEYTFEGPDGPATLADLFAGRRQLIVQHFMFDPSWDAGCPHCTYFVEGLGNLAQLHEKDTTYALVSRAPQPKLAAYRNRMGWTVPWYSSYGSDFNYDFHVTLDESVAPMEYNFRSKDEQARAGNPLSAGEVPGISVFLRDGDTVFHTYSGFDRTQEALMGSVALLDLTPLGG